ncbi:CHASE2 domain-containing protein [Hoeflea prorocentri]|uniref:Adenylate/guanylate cyclase domain-containing protein n=1 Tax=Hoeflea prorocentri TaxID=1922333 RepID=A0A9X3ZIY3_9HYPH|nr:adenylate/guanylate cyclase domain-containing protein [Hoeflea prorocentri]MCY6382468.1 adenylate/guanylate cyclase domain-containing protein [Hoeflea prorocentri]MDA5400268.1 adenylate/guanylate cyclase domain-containing protein [Hoeflea prorocentri]
MSGPVKIGRREVRSGLLGGLAALLVALLLWAAPPSVRERLNQPAADAIAGFWPASSTDRIVVVDIDSASLRDFDGRRLSRRRLADLFEAIDGLDPAVVAIDLVLEPPCSQFDPDVARLQAALAARPATMGFLLSSDPSAEPSQKSPVAVSPDVRLPQAWTAAGAETTCARLVEAASGLSSASLAGGFDARIRTAPAVVAVGNQPFPSLGVDALRLAMRTGALILFGDPPMLRVGDLTARLDSAGDVRLRHSSSAQQNARTIVAADILSGEHPPDILSGKIVFVGSSAAELGGLRPVPGDPVKPSVQIQADLATNLLLGNSPVIPAWGDSASLGAAIVIGIGLAFLGAMTRPLAAAGFTLAAVAGWLGLYSFLYHGAHLMLDPVVPALSMIVGAIVASTAQFSAVRRAESVIRQRFEQRLPGAVVKKLVAEPDLLKLKGEQRVATSMFTDVEGFTTTTERVSPQDMIQLLDRYFEGLTGIIIGYGGMIDKTIGDGIHALFNAPVDLENHEEAALSCARDILAFSEEFRSEGFAKEASFGRTRIGIETGDVVLGDVGVADRVDYTAFGSSVNTAARLQDANKRFGTSILLGPGVRKSLTGDFEDMGEIELRGIGTIHAYGIRLKPDNA